MIIIVIALRDVGLIEAEAQRRCPMRIDDDTLGHRQRTTGTVVDGDRPRSQLQHSRLRLLVGADEPDSVLAGDEGLELRHDEVREHVVGGQVVRCPEEIGAEVERGIRSIIAPGLGV